jgi:hypothetical protein
MNLKIEFKDYLQTMKAQSNRPLNLAVLLAPFGIVGAPVSEDPFLLTGHVLDGLSEQFFGTELIDPADVLQIAEDLGAIAIPAT